MLGKALAPDGSDCTRTEDWKETVSFGVCMMHAL